MVVFRDLRCAAMRGDAALWAAAACAGATTGRTEGILSGWGWGAGSWRGLAVTWRPREPIRSAAPGWGGAWMRSPPFGVGSAGLLQCPRACGSASAGGNSSPGLHSGAGGGWARGDGGVCGSLGQVGVLLGIRLFAAGVCGLLGVGGGEGCSAGVSVAGVRW